MGAHLPPLLLVLANSRTLAGTLWVTRLDGGGNTLLLPPLCCRLKLLLPPPWLLLFSLMTGETADTSGGRLATPVRCWFCRTRPPTQHEGPSSVLVYCMVHRTTTSFHKVTHPFKWFGPTHWQQRRFASVQAHLQSGP